MISDDIDEDDDIDWEAWSALTDDQREAICQAEMKKYTDWLDSLTLLQQYRHHRRRAVEGCLTWRRSTLSFGPGLADFFRDMLKQRQIRLVKLRIWLATGVYPGSA